MTNKVVIHGVRNVHVCVCTYMLLINDIIVICVLHVCK